MLDGDASTVWETERYQDPLETLKPGVGIYFTVNGTPGQLQLLGFSTGTDFEIRWSEVALPGASDWERVAGAQAPPGAASFKLPPRSDGHWLIWMTSLPVQADDAYYAGIAEVRFTP